jgi:glycosyltransferase involved in cell wall biosynthesis
MVSIKERNNYRILWHSVAGYVRSGYGNLTKQVCSRLKQAGFDIYVSAYYGVEPGGVLVINDVPHLPAKMGRFGEISAIHYYQTLKANLAVLFSDPWAFDWFPSKLPHTMCAGPFDHVNYPVEIQNMIRGYTHRVSPSKFQVEEWAKYKPAINWDYVPHGCLVGDTQIKTIDGNKSLSTIADWKIKPIDGKLCKIKTKSGKILCGTQNHEVLTSNGWKAIASLNIGDSVYIHSGIDNKNENDMGIYSWNSGWRGKHNPNEYKQEKQTKTENLQVYSTSIICNKQSNDIIQFNRTTNEMGSSSRTPESIIKKHITQRLHKRNEITTNSKTNRTLLNIEKTTSKLGTTIFRIEKEELSKQLYTGRNEFSFSDKVIKQEIITEKEIFNATTEYTYDITDVGNYFANGFIVHNCDTKIFCPMDKAKAKEALGISPDTFVIGQVAANSDKENRKGFTQGFKAISQFMANNPDVKRDKIKYFLYTNPMDGRGLQIDLFLQKNNIKDITILQNPMVFETGIREQELATIYNAFDVQLYPSFREGWGMTITESMSCGVPNIGHDFSSMPEQIKGRGWLCKSAIKDHTTPINADTAIPDVNSIEECIKEAYFKPDLLKKYGEESRKFALTLDWNDVVNNMWIPILDNIIDESQPKKAEDRKLI